MSKLFRYSADGSLVEVSWGGVFETQPQWFIQDSFVNDIMEYIGRVTMVHERSRK